MDNYFVYFDNVKEIITKDFYTFSDEVREEAEEYIEEYNEENETDFKLGMIVNL
jgi:hypothetical protein